MKTDPNQLIAQIYDLILNPGSSKWERQQLIKAKNQLEKFSPATVLSQLEYTLRPLAIRNNLSPDLTDFYAALTDSVTVATTFDIELHYRSDPPNVKRALFAGGCFWCLVEPFETRPGIIAAIPGYTGGWKKNPTYQQVSSQTSGYVESDQIIYDQNKIRS